MLAAQTDPAARQVSAHSIHGNTYTLPVHLAADGAGLGDVRDPGELREWSVGARSYSIGIVASSELVLEPSAVGLADGGYVVEYTLIELDR
jgi:hypothetical protein